METQIIIEKIIHKGEELDCYVPQINIGNGWKNILSKGSYILKETFNPFIVCKKCDGIGCQDCKNWGFRKGIPVDQIKLAEWFLNEEIKKIELAQETLLKFK